MEPESLICASKLRRYTARAKETMPTSIHDQADEWLTWFANHAITQLKQTAALGYDTASFLLPLPLASRLDVPLYRRLFKTLRAWLPGCTVFLMEEEYEGATYYTVGVSWADSDTIKIVVTD
jgi:hypothetical protein